ncbi:hypothetical protein [Weissella fangxianensis]|uniref:hypothetical protein n=1 Tax=Weissella fangxianensis TaxID=2953879 RepID=UPI0021572529|nr:hypothetical protein [Weissella fangxianensis]
MTNRAYIVANEQQERKVLEKLEREGYLWISGVRPTARSYFENEPMTFFTDKDKKIHAKDDSDKKTPSELKSELVYDGRKE